MKQRLSVPKTPLWCSTPGFNYVQFVLYTYFHYPEPVVQIKRICLFRWAHWAGVLSPFPLSSPLTASNGNVIPLRDTLQRTRFPPGSVSLSGGLVVTADASLLARDHYHGGTRPISIFVIEIRIRRLLLCNSVTTTRFTNRTWYVPMVEVD